MGHVQNPPAIKIHPTQNLPDQNYPTQNPPDQNQLEFFFFFEIKLIPSEFFNTEKIYMFKIGIKKN